MTEMRADRLTKALEGVKHREFVALMGLGPTFILEWCEAIRPRSRPSRPS